MDEFEAHLWDLEELMERTDKLAQDFDHFRWMIAPENQVFPDMLLESLRDFCKERKESQDVHRKRHS